MLSRLRADLVAFALRLRPSLRFAPFALRIALLHFFLLFLLYMRTLCADSTRMDNVYCFPLPLETHRLLIRFWMIDPNGASLCVSDLLDGLCPLRLARELAETIARLEAESAL